MKDEQALRETLSYRYAVEVEYGDGGIELISTTLPIWGCINWASDCAEAWLDISQPDTFYIIASNGTRVMKLSYHHVLGYTWSEEVGD